MLSIPRVGCARRSSAADLHRLRPAHTFTMHSILLLVSACAAYSVCDPAVYPFAGRNVSIPIVASATRTIGTTPVVVSGSIKVLDGCSFQAVDLVLTGPATAQFFGGTPAGSTTGYLLSPTVITASPNPQTLTFNFVTVAGSSISYTDFVEFRLFESESNSMVGTALLPGETNATRTQSPAAKSTASASAISPAAPGQSPRPVVDLSAAQSVGVMLNLFAMLVFVF